MNTHATRQSLAASAPLSFEWRNRIAAIDIAWNLQDWALVINIAESLSTYLLRRGFWSECERLYKCASEAAARIKSPVQKSKAQQQVLINLGRMYIHQERWPEAAASLQRALGKPHQARKANLPDVEIHRLLGDVYLRTRKLKRAREQYEHSLAMAQVVNAPYDMAYAHMALGNVNYSHGRLCRGTHRLSWWSQAKQEHMHALQMLRRIKREDSQEDPVRINSLLAKVLHNLAGVYRDEELWEEAQNCYQESLTIEEEIGDFVTKGTTLWCIGLLHAKQKQWDMALEWGRMALETLAETEDKAELIKTQKMVARWKHEEE